MEHELINDALAGNQNALARLLYENYEIVFKFLIKFTLNRSTAEDLAQETMVRAIERISQYNPAKAKFSTWLVAIAQNIYFDQLRKNKREHKYIYDDSLDSGLMEIPGDDDDSWRTVLEALAHLSEESRVPLILKHYYGYSLEEIAKALSIPLGTVKSRVHNAIKALRRELSLDE